MIKEMKTTKKKQYNAETTALLADYKTIIHGLGEDVTREGLENTRKSSKGNAVSNHGYALDPLEILKELSLLKIIAK
jgi:GTP cyclohydrolase I